MSRRRPALTDVVEVVKDRPESAVLKGARGTVVDVSGDRYWVEFVGTDGDVIALSQFRAGDLLVVWSKDETRLAREQ
ncbi:MAG TPA: DUF4926 domain-containing protein [Coriobacteriia bacterium]|jgi:membrane protein implicated in regulation of membrane protease activity